jgi:hypothetical protein
MRTPAERVVSVTFESHQWLFQLPEGSLGREPTMAKAEHKGRPHDLGLEEQARKEAIKEAVKQGWTKPT